MKATVKYYCKACTRRDGLTPLIASIYCAGRRTRTGALLHCDRSRFDVARQAFRPSARVLLGAAEIPAREANLKLLAAAVEVARLASERVDMPAEEELTAVLEEAFRTGRRKGSPELPEVVETMEEEYRKAGKASGMYRTLAVGLRTYTEYTGRPQTAGNFDPDRFLDFLAHAEEIEEETGVFSRTGRRKPRNATRGGLTTMYRFLRVAASWAVARGFCKTDFMAGHKAPVSAEREPLCLRPDEVERLLATTLPERLADIRDLFVVQCSLGCRQSDLRQLTEAHAAAGVFEYIPTKTGRRSQRVVSVPINRRAATILSGNPRVIALAGGIRLADYNKGIRAAARAAGLDRPVCTYVRDEQKTVPLWSLLSSHAARRTFISTLLNAGVQERVIKDMDGHAADSKAFSRYYTIERETKERAVRVLE